MPLPFTGAVAIAVLLGASARPAAAQEFSAFTPPRGDAAAFFGWFGANKSELDAYEDWYKRVWHGSLSAGYYWTEHLKTEVEFGGTSRGELYEIPRFIDPAAGVFGGAIEHEFSTRYVALGQHYQFLHNTWFHPAVGGGLAFTWETTERRVPPLFIQDPPVGGRLPPRRILEPERTEGPETRLRTLGFASAGFKAYFTTRAFFRSDLRIAFTDRVEDATLRFGFGADW
jgi:hypothetical protein